MNAPPTLIVGIGSPHGDDQAGWQIAERLACQLDPEHVEVRAAASPIQLVDWLDDVDRLILCDACRGMGRVGQIRRWTWPTPELQEVLWSGTHNFSLPAVLQLAERLERLPPDVAIWSVEGAASDAMSAVSAEVAEVLPGMADGIAKEASEEYRCTNNQS